MLKKSKTSATTLSLCKKGQSQKVSGIGIQNLLVNFRLSLLPEKFDFGIKALIGISVVCLTVVVVVFLVKFF